MPSPKAKQCGPKKRVTVIGAGTMGHGIALVFALGGHSVSLVDNQAQQLEQEMGNSSNASGTPSEDDIMKQLENLKNNIPDSTYNNASETGNDEVPE